jgi:hypothetical protein
MRCDAMRGNAMLGAVMVVVMMRDDLIADSSTQT